MKEEWLMSGAVVPVDVETTAALVAEIKRLIDVVGGMVLAQVEQEPVAWMTINEYGEEDDIHYENPEGHLLEGWTYKPLYTHAPTVQPEQEPVAWMSSDRAWMWSDYSKAIAAVANIPTLTLIPLYVAPPMPVQEDAFEGWVKIDEVREHFDSVGCGTIYKDGGEGRVPLYTAPPQRQWDKPSASFDEWWDSDRRRDNANPFQTDSFAYWAFEGWQAARLKEKNR